ncbi:unnamed protein product [Peniophora sp. CBMAI 1063]|nr:unnamed protein product [Peniophora sp. CBMAI 1063]
MRSTDVTSPPPEYKTLQDEPRDDSQRATRHQKYFQGDDMVVLQVENKIFRVSSRWLKANSPRMRRYLQDSSTTGANEEHPTRIPVVTVKHFETLLHFIENGTMSEFTMPAKSWAYLLAVSHFLEITSIKPRAVNEVFYRHYRSFDPVDQLHFYEGCAVDRVALKAAVRQLIIRPEPLNASEMERLSHKLAARVVGLRESFLRSQLHTFGSLFAGSALDALVDGWVMNG